MDKPKVVGSIDARVIDLLGIQIQEGTPILLGKTNIIHMKNEHPEDFDKHGDKISEILSFPDYIAKHPNKDSIEYIKIYDEHILVAVRISKKGTLFARTLFTMSSEKVERYRIKGALKEYRKD